MHPCKASHTLFSPTAAAWLTHQPQCSSDRLKQFQSFVDLSSHCDWVPGVLEWRQRG